MAGGLLFRLCWFDRRGLKSNLPHLSVGSKKIETRSVGGSMVRDGYLGTSFIEGNLNLGDSSSMFSRRRWLVLTSAAALFSPSTVSSLFILRDSCSSSRLS